MTIPQVVGMYKNDRTRKEILVDFGFRLPSALDNRPLTFEEFEHRVNQVLYVSATPGPYELTKSAGVVVEQIIRPTGLLDPMWKSGLSVARWTTCSDRSATPCRKISGCWLRL